MDKQQKPAFLFYASNLDTISVYPEEVQRKIIMWIFQYGFEGEISCCPDDLRDVLSPIFYGIDVQKRRYRNITVLNAYIAKLQYRTARLTDKLYVDAVNNAVQLLKREIVRCQKGDVSVEEVKARIASLTLPPTVVQCLQNEDSQRQASSQPQSSEERYGPKARRA